jgi:hypothetical protein
MHGQTCIILGQPNTFLALSQVPSPPKVWPKQRDPRRRPSAQPSAEEEEEEGQEEEEQEEQEQEGALQGGGRNDILLQMLTSFSRRPAHFFYGESLPKYTGWCQNSE